MQEVCSSLDPHMGAQIKSESPLNPMVQVQTGSNILAAPPQPPPPPPPPNKLIPNCDKRSSAAAAAAAVAAADTAYWMASEGGFINSQPSMAEFLNHLSPESPKMGTTGVVGGYPVGGMPPQTPDGMDSVPEYPWMKEKKTSRKSNNNNQGEYIIIRSFPILHIISYWVFFWQD